MRSLTCERARNVAREIAATLEQVKDASEMALAAESPGSRAKKISLHARELARPTSRSTSSPAKRAMSDRAGDVGLAPSEIRSSRLKRTGPPSMVNVPCMSALHRQVLLNRHGAVREPRGAAVFRSGPVPLGVRGGQAPLRPHTALRGCGRPRTSGVSCPRRELAAVAPARASPSSRTVSDLAALDHPA